MVAAARRVSVRVLQRVEQDLAWATPTLDAELGRNKLGRADAALATQIVYGTLRTLPTLDAALARHTRRAGRMDPFVHAALAAGAFQLLHLARVPSHAVVDDTVEIVRGKRGPRVGGFANAILRKVAAERPRDPRLPERVAVPDWLERRLRRSIGDANTNSLLRLSDAATSTDVRVGPRSNPEAVVRTIRESSPNINVVRTTFASAGLRLEKSGDPRTLGAYTRGEIAVQEEGAQLIGEAPGALPGERVLDACAGRGGKTAQLVQAVGPSGEVTAADLHERRLDQIPDELDRLGIDPAQLSRACVDWTVGQGDVVGEFDRVLVDAPCTGLGTLRRRPEILLRTDAGDAARMGETQAKILARAASLVRPGGTLVYAVCSPLDEEGLEVARGAILPGFRPAKSPPFGLKSLPFGSNPCIRLGPWVEGAGAWADAYQCFVWVHVG
ncbi:MAG: transcription antitermination factor NusB [Myxococcota bacterium]